MNILYIDANIFLGFYNSNKPEFKKLLNSVIEVKTKIFFTEQFKNEIDRNKLNVFKQSIDNYIKQIAITDIALPEHLDQETSSKLKYWNTSRKKLEQQIKDSNNELMKILNETLSNVSSSEDNVSRALSSLYLRSIQPSTDDLIRARYRKEIGNPPGKKMTLWETNYLGKCF
ncbi:PIN domain-containing protein [Flavobacterium sp. P21]|uniref:PIN domain-containing protein n=1 Tax=Flavobacterium sp. P21 TaxID=3423948 RepID=UPI003D666967